MLQDWTAVVLQDWTSVIVSCVYRAPNTNADVLSAFIIAILGAIQVLRNAGGGGGGVWFSGNKRYEGVMFNVISVTRGWLPYLVPSSRIRLLATSVAAPLHPALSLAYRLMLLMVAPLEYPMSVSIHLCLGLPRLLAPFILPSITSSSIPPALTTCPK